MPPPLQLNLTPEARRELEHVRDHEAKAYVREKAAAILKIADGSSASQVARTGLLKRRKYQTVCEWVQRYEAEGVQGLYVQAGRGRKPAFFPSARDGSSGSSGYPACGSP